MAKIPIITPGSTQLVTSTANALQTQTIGTGRGFEKLGSGIEKSANFLYEKLDQARNFTEIAQAEAHDTQTQANELLRADTALDKMGRPRQGSVEDMKDHDEIFKKDEEGIRGYFTNKETEARYMAERQKSIITTKSQIARKYQQNMIDAGKVSTLSKVTTDVQNYATASEDKKDFYAKMIEHNIDQAVKFGFYGEKDAYTLKVASMEDAKLNRFKVDFRTDSRLAEEKFNKGAYGFNVETAEKARSVLRELKVLRQDEYESRRFDLNNRVLSNSINEEEIDQLVRMNQLNPDRGIPEKTGITLKNALYGQLEKTVTSTKQMKKFKAAADMVFSDRADRMKAYDAIIDSMDRSDVEEVKFLNELLNAKKQTKDAAKTGFIDNIYRTLTHAIGFKKYDAEAEKNILKTFINNIRNGDDPRLAAQDALYKQQAIDHPSLIGNPNAADAIYSPGKGTKYLGVQRPDNKKNQEKK